MRGGRGSSLDLLSHVSPSPLPSPHVSRNEEPYSNAQCTHACSPVTGAAQGSPVWQCAPWADHVTCPEGMRRCVRWTCLGTQWRRGDRWAESGGRNSSGRRGREAGGEFRGARAEEKRGRRGPKVQLAAGRTPEGEEMNIRRGDEGSCSDFKALAACVTTVAAHFKDGIRDNRIK